MAISDAEKIDFLWKKVLYGVSKTANALVKSGSNETVASPTTTYAADIWTQANTIPATPPTSNTSTIAVYTGSNAIQMSQNLTSPANVSWLSNMTDFVPVTFGPAYLVKVYGGSPTAGAPQLFPDTTSFEYVFDYVSGALEFSNNIPASVVANGVYIQAYQYTGSTLDASLASLSNSVVDASKTTVVADIAARDALTPNTGDIAHVLDASADAANAGPGEFADYLWTGSFWQCIATQASASSDAKTIGLSFISDNFADGHDELGLMGNGTRVIEISVVVASGFDADADITVGDSTNNALLMDTSGVDLSTPGTYVVTPVYQFPADYWDTISVYYTNSPSTGSATLTMTFA